MRVRLKSRAKGPSKFQSEWSSPHEVVSVKGVVVTLREVSSNRKYVVHHDRLSNPLLSGKPLEPRALEVNANPQENEQDSEEGTLPVRNPDKALMRTRSGRTVKSTRKKDFDYSFILPSFNLSCPSVTSALGARLQSTPLTLKALEAHLLLMPSTSSFAFNQIHSVAKSPCTTSVPLPSRQEARIRREQRARAEQLGQQVFWVLDPSRVELMAFMYKPNGMLFLLDLERQHWTSAFDGATLTQVLKRGDPWLRTPQAPELTDAQVELPRSLAEFPGFNQGLHERPRYGYSDAWQQFITVRALRAAASQASHLPQSSSTILGDSPVASLKAPHMPLAFQAPPTLAIGASSLRSFGSPPTFTSRTGEHLFRPPVAPFSFMQAPFAFQARPGAAPSVQPSWRASPPASGGNVFTTLSLASAFASTTVSAPHAASFAFPQPTPGLLPPPAGPGAQTAPDRTTQGSMSTGQHSDAFTSWSHPASATGRSP